MTTRVLVQNEKDTLPTDVAVADLRATLATEPDLVVLNEWNKARDKATRKLARSLGYGYRRPWRGGGPVLWRDDRYRLERIRSKVLALPGFMGKLPGRRSWLSTSWLTVAILTDKRTGRQVALDGFHLTAEVQDVRGGGGYKADGLHRKRVQRHQAETAKAGRIGRRQLRNGLQPYLAGDTNYDGLAVQGFTNCWTSHGGGDLGGRAVTICYAPALAKGVETIRTHSDHLAVVVTY